LSALAFSPDFAMENVNTTRTCSLKVSEHLRDKDHAFYVRLLLRSTVKASEIKQIDLKGRRGHCKITLSTRAALERLLGEVIHVNGVQLNFLVGDGSVVLLHLFGVNDDMPLSAISKAVQPFGSCIGSPKRETKTVEGCTFSTGTVFVQLVPTATVPSTICVGDANDQVQRLRAWHVGQIQTCYRCGEAEHLAKDCPSKLYSSAVRTNAAIDVLLQHSRRSVDLPQMAGDTFPGVSDDGVVAEGSKVVPSLASNNHSRTDESQQTSLQMDIACGGVSPSASLECMVSVSASNSMEHLNLNSLTPGTAAAQDVADLDEEKVLMFKDGSDKKHKGKKSKTKK